MIAEDLKKINKLLESDLSGEALELCETVLQEYPKTFDALLNKGIILQRMGNIDGSLDTLNQALAVAKERGAREKIGTVCFRMFITYFQNKQYLEAGTLFKDAKFYGCTDPTMSIWEVKLQKKLEKHAKKWEKDFGAPNQEATPIVSEASQPKKDVSQEKRELEEKMANKDNLMPSKPTLKVDWYQSNEAVTISLFVKNVPKDTVNVDIRTTSLDVNFVTATEASFTYELEKLYAPVDPVNSSFKVFGTKIEITLCKQSNIKWKSLEYTGDVVQPMQSTSESSLNYPSSSKKHINWDSIVDDEEKEETSADDFFKSLYANADEDTRRAMMKSYIESNGTALSTNWEEVKKAPVETSPPQGLEAKKW